jgi:hypothetical protein
MKCLRKDVDHEHRTCDLNTPEYSLKGKGNFIAESPLLYLPIRGCF